MLLKLNLQRFAASKFGITINYDSNVTSVDNDGTVFTTSGETKYVFSEGTTYTFTVGMTQGYELDSVTSDYGDISNVNGNSFQFIQYGANGVNITITSKKSTSQVSIDLTTLSGWGNVANGQHSIQVVAKADGYRDSEKSTAVSFTKGSSFTQVPVTLTNPFSSYISMSASNAPFGRISNMDKTKIYSIQLTEDYYKNDITYLTYNGTQWVTNDGLINIKNQTETSVDLYKGLVGGSTSELFNVIALEGTTQASVSDFTGYTGTETMPDYINQH